MVGALTFGSMFCSNVALKFVSYPFVVLSKSAKIIPGKVFNHIFVVIIVGVIRGIYKLHPIQYVLAVSITVGLVLFNAKEVIVIILTH